MEYSAAKKAYASHKCRCGNGGKTDKNGNPVEFHLTFEEWSDIWADSGKWSKRGVGTGKYCMARKGDIGHYELGNIDIILHTQNVIDASIGRTFKHTEEAKRKISLAAIGSKRSAETRKKMRESQLGKRVSEETKMKLSAMNKGRPMKRVNCTKCNFETSPQNLSRHMRICSG